MMGSAVIFRDICPFCEYHAQNLQMFSGTAGVGEIKRNGTYNLPIRQIGRWRCKTKTRCRHY
jgi:hypothetical protein